MHDESGKLHITPRKITEHRWGNKVIPSGFFNLPGAEHVSAVVFSNSGTISKFNRMGLIAGFGSKRVMLVREGFAVDHDPNTSNPRAFRHEVNTDGYSESWVEGIDVFHNPNALLPIEPWVLPGAAHHRLLPDGQLESVTPDWQPLSSVTRIFVPSDTLFSPGIWWSGLRVKGLGCEAHVLQMNSYGVRPLSVLSLRPKLYAATKSARCRRS